MSTLRCGTRSGSLSVFRLEMFNISVPYWHTRDPFLKEDEPMRCDKFGFVIALLAALATQAMAVDVRWAKSTGDFDWKTFGNWETTGDVARGAPVNGENILFQPAHGNNATIDINGATTNLNTTIVYPQDNAPVNLWLYDSATLSPITSPPATNTSFTINGGYASIEAAAAAAQMITVKGINYSK